MAILDTGLALEHEAFNVYPSEATAKYTKATIDSVIRTGALASGVTNADDVYRNQKVPYAYNYMDDDLDVSNEIDHGTHVAGTVAGNNGKDFFGVAPNAQLLVMKVFNSDGSTSDSALTAALDDAVKLGADSINMSLGSPAGFYYRTEDEDESGLWRLLY